MRSLSCWRAVESPELVMQLLTQFSIPQNLHRTAVSSHQSTWIQGTVPSARSLISQKLCPCKQRPFHLSRGTQRRRQALEHFSFPSALHLGHSLGFSSDGWEPNSLKLLERQFSYYLQHNSKPELADISWVSSFSWDFWSNFAQWGRQKCYGRTILSSIQILHVQTGALCFRLKYFNQRCASTPETEKGSSLMTRLSHILAGRAFQSLWSVCCTQMGPGNKIFTGWFWWGCPFSGARRCVMDFSHFSPNRPSPFSRWIINYWAMRKKKTHPRKVRLWGFWGSFWFELRGDMSLGEKHQDVGVCCMSPTIKTPVPRELQPSNATGVLRCTRNEYFRASWCLVLLLRTK